MKALRRVLGAPGLVLAVVALQLGVGAAVGMAVRAGVGAAMGRWTILADGHLLYAIVELLVEHPGPAAVARQLLAGSAVVALLFWTLLAAGILHRLRGPASAADVAAAAVRGLPGVVVVTLWHLIPRAVLLAAVGALTAKLLGAQAWGLLGIALTVAVVGYATCALDLARAAVVLHGAARFHPRTAVRGFLRAARRPDVLFPSMLLSAGQFVCVAAIVALGFAGMGTGWAIWSVRALAIVGVFLGLCRMAVAVEAGPERRLAERGDPGTRSRAEMSAPIPGDRLWVR